MGVSLFLANSHLIIKRRPIFGFHRRGYFLYNVGDCFRLNEVDWAPLVAHNVASSFIKFINSWY